MCEPCEFWNTTIVPPSNATPGYFADVLGVRVGGIVEFDIEETAPMLDRGLLTSQVYAVTVIFDETDTLTFS
jgi:hypothetical protein